MRPDIQAALAEFNTDTPDWYIWIDLSAGEVFSNVKVIRDGAVLPTEEDFNAKLAELQAAYDEANSDIAKLRAERNQRLANTDWWVMPDRTATQAQLDYRQALRDITDTYTSLDDVVWPEDPA